MTFLTFPHLAVLWLRAVGLGAALGALAARLKPPMRPPLRAAWAASNGSNARSSANKEPAERRSSHD